MKLKKNLALLCTIGMLFATSMPALALDGPSETENPNDPVTVYHDYYAIGNDESYPNHINVDQKPSSLYTQYSVLATNAYVKEQAWATDGIAIYYQDDIDPSLTCSGGTPVAKVGCAITSFAMVLAKYGVNVTPEEVYTKLRASGGITASCEMTWSASAVSSAFNGITMEHWLNTNGGNYLESVGKTTIEGILKTGKPVIVGLKKVGTSNTRHFVVCYGYEKYSDGGSYHYLFNPSRGASTTLEGYMSNWYIESFTTLYK